MTNNWTAIKKKYRIYSNQKMAQIKKRYATPKEFDDAMMKDIYRMLIIYLDKAFKYADELALELCPNLEFSIERCKWACRWIIKKEEANGHTRMDCHKLAQELHKSYGVLMPYVVDAVSTDMFYYDKEDKWVSMADTYKAECNIAKTIKERMAMPIEEDEDIDWQNYKELDDMTLTDEQLLFLKTVNENNVVMLNGSSGSGKSATTKALIEMLDDNCHSYTLVAPTGIAAKRLRQATNRDAKTIHMHLACGDICEEYLIIDEFSMVGVHLLDKLFNTLANDTKIIFICDEAQLPSISCGNLTHDIIDSHIVPIVNLTHIFRYTTSGIIKCCTDTRMGVDIDADMSFDDYEFMPIGDNAIDDVMSAYEYAKRQYAEDDIIILSPFNKLSAGTYLINNRIQSTKYSEAPIHNQKISGYDINLHIGDLVVNTENNYSMPSDGIGTMAVMNGDIGRVMDYNGSEIQIAFDNGIAYAENNWLNKLLPAYALSVHKVQGTQAKCVIVVIDKSHGWAIYRNLLYTAVSRAQEKLIIVGDIDTYNEALKKQQTAIRETWLKEMLIA